jgi:hypothetical protein
MELHFASDELGDWFDLHKAIDEAPEDVPCRQWPDVFHPEKGAQGQLDARIAKSMCRNCPVLAQCADYGLKWAEQGIWGGLSAHDRRRINFRVTSSKTVR